MPASLFFLFLARIEHLIDMALRITSFAFKAIAGLLMLILILGLGVWLGRSIYQKKAAQTAREQADVILERIQKVAKLVTVEGHFTELYDYKDYWRFDWTPFQKKALLRIKGKVSMGYDLSKLKVETLPDQKLVRISNLPDPVILSIEHDVDYYDITQGIFNRFTSEDFTKLNQNAKKILEEKALQSDLKISAVNQGEELFGLLKSMVESAGWKMEFVPDSIGGFKMPPRLEAPDSIILQK